jgi:hypothetical protein
MAESRSPARWLLALDLIDARSGGSRVAHFLVVALAGVFIATFVYRGFTSSPLYLIAAPVFAFIPRLMAWWHIQMSPGDAPLDR